MLRHEGEASKGDASVRGVTATRTGNGAVETIDAWMHDKQHWLSCYFLPGPRPTLVEPGPELSELPLSPEPELSSVPP